MSAALKLTFGSLFCYSRHFISTNKADNILRYQHLSLFSLIYIVAVLPASWQCLFCIFLNSLGFSTFVFILTWLTSKNSFSSDAVKCAKQQIRPITHKVLQTPSYLSYLLCYADNTRRIFIGQGHMFKLLISYNLQPVFLLRCFGHLSHISIKISRNSIH